MNDKHYYKVDVSGRYGYSFMVESDIPLLENDVLESAIEQDLFYDDDDVEYATVDMDPTEYDVKHFKNDRCCYKI
jgi:hypothetical protein